MEACFGRAVNYTTDNFNDNYSGSEIAYFWVGTDLKSKHLLPLQSYALLQLPIQIWKSFQRALQERDFH